MILIDFVFAVMFIGLESEPLALISTWCLQLCRHSYLSEMEDFSTMLIPLTLTGCLRRSNTWKMPLFHSKFSIPKLPSRKSSSMTNLSQLDSSVRNQEFGLDYGAIKARLSGRDLVFANGKWVVSGGGQRLNGTEELEPNSAEAREAIQVKKENKKMMEENNLLKLKVEILLDMLAETTAEVHLQENEIESLRGLIHQKPSHGTSQPTLTAT